MSIFMLESLVVKRLIVFKLKTCESLERRKFKSSRVR